MLDFSHIPTPYGAANVETFTANTTVAGGAWQTWTKPRGKSMAHILLVGAGGGGGNSATAAAASGGSGGGSSGAQVSIMVPLWAIPDVLFLSLAFGGTAQISYVSIAQNTTANNTLLLANAGANGSSSVGTAAGAAGGAATAPAANTMPLGWQWLDQALAGQVGTAGGVATTVGAAGGAITLPTTGLLVTGGAGGGACPTTVGTGLAGGAFTVAGVFPAHAAGTAGALTTPPDSGQHGYRPIANLLYGYGGTGGGGVGSNATGAGLVGASGGNGAPGCGGGGAGGCFTGSTLGVGGLGGPAFCIITCW